jgi:predicted nuclease of predicted toxin-antitoxin system
MNGFLFDENLPHRLRFTPSLPVSHATDVGTQPTDAQLWEYAKQHSLVIVTKDVDFSDRILIAEPPPWIIHLLIGNLRTSEFHSFLAGIWPRVESFLPTNKLIQVYRDHIEAVS